MNLNDFENQELSIEELDAIAGGWPHWLHSAVDSVGHFFGNATVQKVLAVGFTIAGTIFGGWANKQLNPPPQN
jgi:hypothetical protein